MKHVFVFGSNLAGRHGKGAALFARKHYGAIYGQGVGMQGHSYAIPTKDYNLRTLPLATIEGYVEEFKSFTREHPDKLFIITPIGTGLAGYSKKDIWPMFKGVGSNCVFSHTWC
ncbi:MAG TPA: hypothetical protein VK031_09460 [Tissierellaceae bacterium]|nr:hypothetical protein [Tissierellaceae bacterium]